MNEPISKWVIASRTDPSDEVVEIADHPMPLPMLEIARVLTLMTSDVREIRVRFDGRSPVRAIIRSRSGVAAEGDKEIVRSRFGVEPNVETTDPEDAFLEEQA